MFMLRRLLVALCVAPFALALAACSSDSEDAAPAKHDAIAPIAAPAGKNWVDMAAETPEGGFRIGNPNAPIKLVEYASHTCPHCAEFSVTGAAPLDAYVGKGTVSYEIRNLVRDPVDLTVAMLARCGPPEAFHPLADQWWANFNEVMQRVQSAGPALQAASQQPPAVRFQAMAQAENRRRVLSIRTRLQDDGKLYVGVQDNGPGIAANDLDHLFTAFFTTKGEGMGMGLSICRSIIDAHGGKIWVSSREGEGALFQFVLPALKAGE